jgi:disulfide bond formation protein DsbB
LARPLAFGVRRRHGDCEYVTSGGDVMGRAFILWLLGVPASVLVVLWLIGFFH